MQRNMVSLFFTVDHVNAAPNIIVSLECRDRGQIERTRLLFAHIFQVRLRRRNAERNERHNTHFHALLGFKTRSRLVLLNLTSSCPRITERVFLLRTLPSIVAPLFGHLSNYVSAFNRGILQTCHRDKVLRTSRFM